MDEAVNITEVDVVSESGLRELAGHREGPCVSIFLPTHRAGPETRQDPVRLRNLLGEAEARLGEQGLGSREASELLAPVAALEGDTLFWRHLADGLAVFLAPGLHQRFRVPLDLEEGVFVGEGFRLRPLVPLVSGDGSFFVLALSQNGVQLFEGTQSSIGEVTLGSTPTSMAEALAHEDHQPQLQVRSSGKGSAAGQSMFHGHGVGGEVDKQQLERFFRAVDTGVGTVLGDSHRPLVLACVAYYAPIFRAVSRYPVIVEGCVEGNPEGRSAQDLHAGAWPLVAPVLAAARREAEARLASEAGTGRSLHDPAAIAVAARQGRVGTLFVSGAETVWGRIDPDGQRAEVHDVARPGDEDLLEQATRDTLVTSGSVFVAEPKELPGGGPAAALVRY